ncbi:MAG TPA: hypothetical protein VHD56_00755 [Tepidisphaeraceae bacterium]|nr:hypothetical protein [Tepidisphaeraceae bacterium]
MFGSHLSIAGGMYSALLEAEKLDFRLVRLFSKNLPIMRDFSLLGAWLEGKSGRWQDSRLLTLGVFLFLSYMTIVLAYRSWKLLRPGGDLRNPRSVFIFYAVLLGALEIFMVFATCMMFIALVQGD